MPTSIERLVWPELRFALTYTASLPCCGQSQDSGHSCVSPGSAAGVARGTLFSPRGVALPAPHPVLFGAGLAASLVWDRLFAAVPADPEFLGPFAPVFGRPLGGLSMLRRSLPGALAFPLLFRFPLDLRRKYLLWRSGFWLRLGLGLSGFREPSPVPGFQQQFLRPKSCVP